MTFMQALAGMEIEAHLPKSLTDSGKVYVLLAVVLSGRKDDLVIYFSTELRFGTRSRFLNDFTNLRLHSFPFDRAIRSPSGSSVPIRKVFPFR